MPSKESNSKKVYLTLIRNLLLLHNTVFGNKVLTKSSGITSAGTGNTKHMQCIIDVKYLMCDRSTTYSSKWPFSFSGMYILCSTYDIIINTVSFVQEMFTDNLKTADNLIWSQLYFQTSEQIT